MAEKKILYQQVIPGGTRFFTHDCPGLLRCTSHPKWRVVVAKGLGEPYKGGIVIPPNTFDSTAHFPSHAEAFAYAHKEATR